MQTRDTSPKAADLQIQVHRQFPPARRLAMAIEMSEFARKLSRAGLRSRNPAFSDEQLDEEMLNLLYGFRRKRS